MKKFVLSVFAIAAMASCMQDETISQNQQAIDFGTPFVDKATKATDNTYSGTADLTEFKVYGTVEGTGAGVVNIYNGVEVTGGVGDAEWTYGDEYKQYWIEGATYNFAAVVDAKTVGQDAAKMPTTLVPATTEDGKYLKDLLYASDLNYKAESPYKVVDFNFAHLLSKAHFTVTSETEGGYYHKVTGIKINNFSTGTYTINGGTWSTAAATATDKAYELGDIAKITSTTGAQTNATQVLLYPTDFNFTVEFTVELWNSNGSNGQPALLSQVHYTSAATVASGTRKDPITVSTDLLKGHAYNFKLNLTVGELIQFTVTQAPSWVEPTDQNGGNITL